MTSQIQYLSEIAASGTDSLVIAVPAGTRSLGIKVAANFGHSTTSGLSTVVTVAPDGSTFGTSNVTIPVLKAAAAGEVETEIVVHLEDHPYKQDPGPVTAITLSFTNNDGTYDAIVSVLTEDYKISAAQ